MKSLRNAVKESLRIGMDDNPEYETILENIYDIYSSYSNATRFSGINLSIHTKVKEIIDHVLGGSFGSLNRKIIMSTMTKIEYEFTKHKCPLELTSEEYYDAYYISYDRNKKGVNDPAQDLIVNSFVEMEYWDHKQNYVCEMFDVTLSSSAVLEVIYHPNNYYSVCIRSLDTDNIWAYLIVKMK